MHEVTPKVVAMAVSTVMTMFRILLQRALLLFSMMILICGFMNYDFFFLHHRVHRVPRSFKYSSSADDADDTDKI